MAKDKYDKQTRNKKSFWAGEVLWNQSTSINLSSKTQEKKVPQGKFWSFFSQILSKLRFEWKIQPKDGHNQSLFFQNQGTFFDFQKRAGEASPPPTLVAPGFIVDDNIVINVMKVFPFLTTVIIFRSSLFFCEKSVLKHFSKFTGKHLRKSLFFNPLMNNVPKWSDTL